MKGGPLVRNSLLAPYQKPRCLLAEFQLTRQDAESPRGSKPRWKPCANPTLGFPPSITLPGPMRPVLYEP